MGLNLLSGCQGFYMCVQALGSRPNPAVAMHRRDGMLGGHQCVEVLQVPVLMTAGGSLTFCCSTTSVRTAAAVPVIHRAGKVAYAQATILR